MTPSPVPGATPALPVAVLILAMACFQSGGSLGKTLFPLVGPSGATALRMSLSALILMTLTRPWRGGIPRSSWPPLLAYGLAMAGLNAFFFLAIRTIPIGVAVAIDFLGPLGVALAHSRRWLDGAWALLAAAGIAALLPIGPDAVALDPTGLALSFCAATCWALYILAGRRAGATLSSARATALGLTIAATAVLPFGIATAGTMLLAPSVLPTALVIAVLSSAVPYRLEMFALTRMTPRLFGVLMSLEPALAALFGWLILGEYLLLRQGLAIALIILASAGATLSGDRPQPAGDT